MFHWIKRASQAEHQFCQDNLSPFLDRQLTPHEQARITRHLQECADCRADLASLRQTVTILRAMPVVKPPRSFFIPASEGVRKTQVQRSRLAYGYLQFATAVATVLLVLVVSGDALLRLGVSRSARQTLAPNVEITAVDTEVGAPEPMPTSAPDLRIAESAPTTLGAVPPPPVGKTAVTMVPQPVAPDEVTQTKTAQAVTDNQTITAKAMPSETFARPAGAPPLPTVTLESGATAPPAAEVAQPELTATLQPGPTAVPPTPAPAPTQTPVPQTATPLPTETPVPPTATPMPLVEPTSPPPAEGELERREPPPPAPAGQWGLLQALQPLLPWLEWILGALVVVLLMATLWLRHKQRAA